jgi:hypothetical protein
MKINQILLKRNSKKKAKKRKERESCSNKIRQKEKKGLKRM